MTLKEYLDNHKISSLIDAARFFNLSGKKSEYEYHALYSWNKNTQ
jgi:hypothetical protein